MFNTNGKQRPIQPFFLCSLCMTTPLLVFFEFSVEIKLWTKTLSKFNNNSVLTAS